MHSIYYTIKYTVRQTQCYSVSAFLSSVWSSPPVFIEATIGFAMAGAGVVDLLVLAACNLWSNAFNASALKIRKVMEGGTVFVRLLHGHCLGRLVFLDRWSREYTTRHLRVVLLLHYWVRRLLGSRVDRCRCWRGDWRWCFRWTWWEVEFYRGRRKQRRMSRMRLREV